MDETVFPHWRRLPADERSPAGRQFALGEALLACMPQSNTPALRWYAPRRPALALGNGQRPEQANLAACAVRGVAVYRRSSGGTAVLVDSASLNLELALPATHPLVTSDVVRGYRWIGELWAEALRTLGVERAHAIPTEEVRARSPLAQDDPLRLACYGTLSPWEVVVGQGQPRKLVGLSQVRRRAGALHHIGVHLRWRPERLAPLLAIPSEEQAPLIGRLREAAVGLDELLGAQIEPERVIAAVEATLARRLGVELIPSAWSEAEREAADRLERERFQAIALP